ncbi:extracellular solute-binding protein [Streptomyces sp. HNM0574]|uniref:extracellular solute-binding protein n=1 Tax=Streptomyces sp. HNM0574 TaxID=2714954 RepID=UPI001F0FA527|nr:extracellular solute-binding protein [Streptomyces sp. HNM0574]
MGLAATGVAAGAVGVTAAGCSGPGSDSVTLKLVAADYGDPSGDNSSQEYWEDLVRAFTKKYPDISVDITVHSWNDVDRKVAEMVKDGDPPDLAQIGAYANYANEGELYSASDLLSIPVQADFVPGLADAGAVTRVQYGMPFVSSTRLLFFNKTLFTEAGLDPEAPPESWKELKKAASALKSAGVKIPYGLPLGPEEAPAETLMWMLTGGGGYTDKVGHYTIDSAANVRTFTFLRDELVGAGLTNPDPGATDRQDLFDAFSRGEVGMLNGHPTLIQQIARGDVDYGTAVVPGVDGPSEATLGVADWMMAFSHNGRKKELGTFLDFVYAEKQHYALVDRYDLLPVTTAARERMRRDPEHKQLWRFLDQLSEAEYYPDGKVSWAHVSAAVKERIGSAVEKGGNPKNVLSSLQRLAETEESSARS